MNATFYAPDWLDKTLYPFDHKFMRLEAGTMHYLDEGTGDVLLFVHGTPTWSFLYRDFIKDLSKDYRCIAIDHLGFGLSETPDGFSGRPEEHAKNLVQFIERLDLRNITLVVHDFGGPIGLAAGLELPDRIKKIVLFNTWLWATEEDKTVKQVDWLANSWLGSFLYLHLNFSPRFLLKQAFADKAKLSKAVHKQYLRPFPDKNSRKPLLQIARALAGSSDWYAKQWLQLDRLADKDWLILWGEQDPFLSTEFLAKWRNRLPQARVRTFNCGHFVQEEAAQEAIREIQGFLA